MPWLQADNFAEHAIKCMPPKSTSRGLFETVHTLLGEPDLCTDKTCIYQRMQRTVWGEKGPVMLSNTSMR